MTSPEEHKNNVKQYLEDINEKIRAGQLLERQKIIGFTASESATNLIEYFFHRKNAVSPGFRLNHSYFASEQKAKRYLDFEFPHKAEIISLMVNQEKLRDLLCYGKQKDIQQVMEAINNLMKIKELVKSDLGEEI